MTTRLRAITCYYTPFSGREIVIRRPGPTTPDVLGRGGIEQGLP